LANRFFPSLEQSPSFVIPTLSLCCSCWCRDNFPCRWRHQRCGKDVEWRKWRL